MSIFTRFDRHAALAGQMADTLGADLVEEACRSEFGVQRLRGAVLNCMACGEVGACEDWLAEHPDGASEAPGYCRNKAMLDALAALK